MTKKQHGGPRTAGPGKKMGRPPLPGYDKYIRHRVMSQEEVDLINSVSPRRRTELLVQAIKDITDKGC